ncbi:unnamed protein product [Chrysodeixis includens]|uniref:Uncharacterized protein n=1 Tax=Chrysodeixis includens TaxID=689277 RepID=A0A9N8L0X8_CHRIL|nr:unnamed protein product [Chrysodeixis includens]
MLPYNYSAVPTFEFGLYCAELQQYRNRIEPQHYLGIAGESRPGYVELPLPPPPARSRVAGRGEISVQFKDLISQRERRQMCAIVRVKDQRKWLRTRRPAATLA